MGRSSDDGCFPRRHTFRSVLLIEWANHVRLFPFWPFKAQYTQLKQENRVAVDGTWVDDFVSTSDGSPCAVTVGIVFLKWDGLYYVAHSRGW